MEYLDTEFWCVIIKNQPIHISLHYSFFFDAFPAFFFFFFPLKCRLLFIIEKAQIHVMLWKVLSFVVTCCAFYSRCWKISALWLPFITPKGVFNLDLRNISEKSWRFSTFFHTQLRASWKRTFVCENLKAGKV